MSNRKCYYYLGVILVAFAAMSIFGITWGLPTRAVDSYLFGDAGHWSGEKIYRLAGADQKFDRDRGADVDADPIARESGEPIPLTDTDADIARILLRYRLYTHQPDEMITMMALAGMNPRSLDLDPRLYQYGGLFIYPVGAMIRLCGAVGLIDVRSDVVYYLDHPGEFGKFYVVARAYAAAWGLIGVVVVFAIARRLGGPGAGLLAAILFTLMPVVVCMSHEGKPHLPGAVLMLIAVWCAMQCLLSRAAGFSLRDDSTSEEASASAHSRGLKPAAQEETPLPHGRGGDAISDPQGTEARDPHSLAHSRGLKPAAQEETPLPHGRCSATVGDRERTEDGGSYLSARRRGPRPVAHEVFTCAGERKWFCWMCVACGAALGMVLSSWPVFVLIPLTAWWTSRGVAGTKEDGRAGAGSLAPFIRRTFLGVAIAAVVYLITNPYVAINAVTHRDVLGSNVGNSLAMYEVARVGEGFLRVLELTVEGVTFPLLALGVVGLVVAVARRNRSAAPLAIAAGVFFIQFVLIGAGKPAEYGRFGVFPNAALAIAAACVIRSNRISGIAILRWACPIALCVFVGLFGAAYLRNFLIDATSDNSRTRAARRIERCFDQADGSETAATIAVLADPAPYGCPPLRFAARRVVLRTTPDAGASNNLLVRAVERSSDPTDDTTDGAHDGGMRRPTWLRDTPISWANKPFDVAVPPDGSSPR